MPRPANPIILTPKLRQEFWERVEIQAPGECWLWNRSHNRAGYPIMPSKPVHSAHRVSWVIANDKDIPPGLVIDHTCNNRGCVNPDHLQAIPTGQNTGRALRNGGKRRPRLPAGASFEDRFMNVVDYPGAEASLANQNLCWPWGYSTAVWPASPWGQIQAWKASYLLFCCPDEETEEALLNNTLEIDHTCRNNWCVRPSHLEAVTREENQRRKHLA